MVIGDCFKALPTGFLDPIGCGTGPTTSPEARLERSCCGQIQFDPPTATCPLRHALQLRDLRRTSAVRAAYDADRDLEPIGLYGSLTALTSETNETNFLTSRYPHILRTACLAQAYNFMNEDEREAKALAKLAAYIQKANAEADDSYRGLVVSNEVA
jgi:hypothetical protein